MPGTTTEPREHLEEEPSERRESRSEGRGRSAAGRDQLSRARPRGWEQEVN